MRPRARPERSVLVTCLLTVLLPAISCALAWPVMSASTTARECATGSSGSSANAIVFVLLVLLTPAGIAAQNWRMRGRALHAALAVLIGTAIAVIAIYVTISFWWSGHDCMT